MRLLLITGIACLLVTSASAGPFGLTFGAPSSAMGVTPDDRGYAPLNAVPSPHPDLSNYTGRFSPSYGLCEVRALAPIKDNGRALNGMIVYDRLKAALTKKYGPPDDDVDGAFDPDDPSVAPEHRLYALSRNFWLTTAQWDMPSPDLHAIVLIMQADNVHSMTAPTVFYQSKDGPACTEEIERQGDSSL